LVQSLVRSVLWKPTAGLFGVHWCNHWCDRYYGVCEVVDRVVDRFAPILDRWLDHVPFLTPTFPFYPSTSSQNPAQGRMSSNSVSLTGLEVPPDLVGYLNKLSMPPTCLKLHYIERNLRMHEPENKFIYLFTTDPQRLVLPPGMIHNVWMGMILVTPTRDILVDPSNLADTSGSSRQYFPEHRCMGWDETARS